MAKGKIVNTTLQGKHSLERTRFTYLVKVPAGGKTKDPGYIGRTWAWKKGRRPATGAGSINCEDEIRSLIDNGRAEKAAALYDAHHRIRGAAPIRRMHLWRRLYELGDKRARGVA